MIKSKETKCGVYTANDNNPLGLFRQGSQYYQLIGFFNYMDSREYLCDMRGTLPFSRFAASCQRGWNCGSIYSLDSPSENNNTNHNIIAHIRHFKLDDTEIVYLQANFKICYLFKIYREPISFKSRPAAIKEQAICDFLHHNEFIPQIMSENRLANEMSHLSTGIPSFANGKHTLVNKKLFTDSIDGENTAEKIKDRWLADWLRKKYTPEYIIEKQTKEERLEPAFSLNSDYLIIGKEKNIDLLDIQKRIKTQANRKGGFVNFEYKSIEYKIPLLPLLCWNLTTNIISKDGILKTPKKYKLQNNTWYTVSPNDIKTSNDNLFHSDWWIGAGFPIELYKESYKFKAFNKAVTNFALDITGKNTLDDVTFLSGQNTPETTGRIVKYPRSLEDFNEDDILVLATGGVEFDLYLKKSCKNGKGGIIVEVGNKTAHLTIVSNEYNLKNFNYRLILLPDADKLLVHNSMVKIEPKNNRIIPL
jgi:hypothetical protein